MSTQALDWARRQTVGDAHAKSLLRAIADYCDEDGRCFPSLGRLAGDCELSDDTIRRKAKLLEDGGWLVRVKAWMDEHGHRNFEGRGRETSHEIRLLFNRPTTLGSPPSSPHGNSPSDGPSVCGEGLQPARVAACKASGDGGGGVALVPPPNEPPLNQEDSPQSPPLASGSAQGSAKDETETNVIDHPGLERFRNTYGEPSRRPATLAGLWAALTDVERKRAQRGAEGVAEVRKKNPKRSFVDPVKFVGDPLLWDEFARFARPESTQLPAREFVAVNSEAWRAHFVYRQLCRLSLPAPKQIEGLGMGCLFLPLPPSALALAIYFDTNWMITFQGARQCYAWLERIKEWTGKPLELERIWIDAEGHPVATAAEAEIKVIGGRQIPQSRQGLRVPCEWPPTKGGTGSTGPPPLAPLSDEESDEFTKGL
jgi:hypothetical protein